MGRSVSIRRRHGRWGQLAVVLWALAVAVAGCSRSDDPIDVEGGNIRVRNLTDSDWTNVRIWVNDYYAGEAREIPAGGFVNEPASRFVASRGQRFDPRRTPVTSVVVLATDASGERIRVVWGSPALH